MKNIFKTFLSMHIEFYSLFFYMWAFKLYKLSALVESRI